MTKESGHLLVIDKRYSLAELINFHSYDKFNT